MNELTLQLANELIRISLETARARNMPPIAVAVLDSGGHLKALQREDGVSFMRVQIAQAKAWGALGMGVNTDQIAQRYLKNEQQRGFINALNSMTAGHVIPLPGGVLILNNQSHIIGAIGAAGGESSDDEQCLFQAIDKVGLYR